MAKVSFVKELNKALSAIGAKVVELGESTVTIEYGTSINQITFNFANALDRTGFECGFVTPRSYDFKYIDVSTTYTDHCRFVCALSDNTEVANKVRSILEHHKNWVEDEFLKRLHKTA